MSPGEWSLVRASGDIDIATAAELDDALLAAATDEQPVRHLVLDLGAVTFLDCAGLRPLVAARRRLTDRFWLVNPPPQVRRLLSLTGLTDAFAYLDDVPAVTLLPQHRTAGDPGTEAGTA
ncbi:STAS domain-containing protein [Kineosporia sp. A_224]|uniref:STAS domain-containing protein n=1 Tax=Kineosporia sp. A_224 TaxID=1962180 RepID=UPI0013040950|nr:STAS domain-containing protein [Kineosporia sp. A_224]